MSTKIYNGMIAKVSMKELVEELKEFRSNIPRTLERAFRKDFAEEPDSTIELIFHPYREDATLAIVLPQYSLSVSLGNDSNVMEKLAASTSLEEYGYWNNTDRPDDIDIREWKEREKVWGAAVGNKYLKYYSLSFFLADRFSLTKKRG